MRPRRTVSILGLALAVAVFSASTSAAFVAHPNLDYDIDSPPAPSPPSQNQLDLYVPDGVTAGDSRPLVVYVHGGAWRTGDKANQIASKRDLFTGAGYLFASVNYRLSPGDTTALDPARVRFPAHPHDVGEAIGWLAANAGAYGGDPTRILLIGHSAGAHQVQLVSTDPRYVRAYDVEPWQLIGTVSLDTDAIDVANRIAEGGPQTKSVFYNAFGTPEENAADDSWRRASPIAWADELDPRMLLVTQGASADRMENNASMATALGQDPEGVVGVPYDHEGINDAVGTPDPAGETAAITAFFQAMVNAARDPAAKLARHPAKRVRDDARKVTVDFKLKADQPHASFECRLDSKKLRPCARERSYRVGRGRHEFRYRALSERGRPGRTREFAFRAELSG